MIVNVDVKRGREREKDIHIYMYIHIYGRDIVKILKRGQIRDYIEDTKHLLRD